MQKLFLFYILLGLGMSQALRPKLLEIIILEEIPHVKTPFTQGLVFDENKLYESGGLYGKSSLREISLPKGDLIREKALDPKLFGEGLAMRGDTLYQLTWKSGKLLRYLKKDFSTLSSWKYKGEGWGLTILDNKFFMSDGSSVLQVRDDKFQMIRSLPITYAGRPLEGLNELETAQGLIFANVWGSELIYQIDPLQGQVVGVANATILRDKQRPLPQGSVLNGIAWNPHDNTFYVTGKNWHKIFRVRFELK